MACARAWGHKNSCGRRHRVDRVPDACSNDDAVASMQLRAMLTAIDFLNQGERTQTAQHDFVTKWVHLPARPGAIETVH